MMATQLQLPPIPIERIAIVLARYDRPKLAAFINVAIDLLDALDGDADFEDTAIEDGDTLDLGEAQAETEILATKPKYGVDQTLGPINEVEAVRVHKLAIYRQ